MRQSHGILQTEFSELTEDRTIPIIENQTFFTFHGHEFSDQFRFQGWTSWSSVLEVQSRANDPNCLQIQHTWFIPVDLHSHTRAFNLNSERKHKHFLRAKINSTNFGTKQTIATGIFEPAGDTIFIPQGTLFFWYIPITTHDCLRSNLLFNLFVCLKTHRNHSGEADSCCLLNLGQWNIDHRKQLKNVHKSICKTKVICVQPSFECKRFTPKHTCINTQTTVFKCVTSKICKGMLPKIYLYWSSD